MADALLAAAPVSDQSGNAYNGHTTSTVILAALFTASSMLGLLIYHCCKFLRDRAWRNYSGNEPSPNPALEEGNTNSGSFGSSFSSGSACGKEENKGLPDCAIDELPRIGILELARMKGGKDGLECCPVCLSEFDSGEEGTIRLLPACGHCFHACCIDLWLHSHASCPVCRHPLLADGNSSHLKPDSSAPVSGVDFHPITISDADDSEDKSDDDEEIDSDEEDPDAESG